MSKELKYVIFLLLSIASLITGLICILNNSWDKASTLFILSMIAKKEADEYD
jgi:hypothetical protein